MNKTIIDTSKYLEFKSILDKLRDSMVEEHTTKLDYLKRVYELTDYIDRIIFVEPKYRDAVCLLAKKSKAPLGDGYDKYLTRIYAVEKKKDLYNSLKGLYDLIVQSLFDEFGQKYILKHGLGEYISVNDFKALNIEEQELIFYNCGSSIFNYLNRAKTDVISIEKVLEFLSILASDAKTIYKSFQIGV